jgi:hypothetical protein
VATSPALLPQPAARERTESKIPKRRKAVRVISDSPGGGKPPLDRLREERL